MYNMFQNALLGIYTDGSELQGQEPTDIVVAWVILPFCTLSHKMIFPGQNSVNFSVNGSIGSVRATF